MIRTNYKSFRSQSFFFAPSTPRTTNDILNERLLEGGEQNLTSILPHFRSPNAGIFKRAVDLRLLRGLREDAIVSWRTLVFDSLIWLMASSRRPFVLEGLRSIFRFRKRARGSNATVSRAVRRCMDAFFAAFRRVPSGLFAFAVDAQLTLRRSCARVHVAQMISVNGNAKEMISNGRWESLMTAFVYLLANRMSFFFCCFAHSVVFRFSLC